MSWLAPTPSSWPLPIATSHTSEEPRGHLPSHLTASMSPTEEVLADWCRLWFRSHPLMSTHRWSCAGLITWAMPSSTPSATSARSPKPVSASPISVPGTCGRPSAPRLSIWPTGRCRVPSAASLSMWSACAVFPPPSGSIFPKTPSKRLHSTPIPAETVVSPSPAPSSPGPLPTSPHSPSSSQDRADTSLVSTPSLPSASRPTRPLSSGPGPFLRPPLAAISERTPSPSPSRPNPTVPSLHTSSVFSVLIPVPSLSSAHSRAISPFSTTLSDSAILASALISSSWLLALASRPSFPSSGSSSPAVISYPLCKSLSAISVATLTTSSSSTKPLPLLPRGLTLLISVHLLQFKLNINLFEGQLLVVLHLSISNPSSHPLVVTFLSKPCFVDPLDSCSLLNPSCQLFGQLFLFPRNHSIFKNHFNLLFDELYLL